MQKPVIGFIGLGLMGHGMAANILKNGYDLRVLAHRNRTNIDDLVSKGAIEVDSPAQMAAQCDIIHLCVSGSPQVEENIRGTNGILSAAQPGLIVIDCSTSDPVSTQALNAEMAARDVILVDAPLSRTPKEAAEGTLDAMVGCSPEVLEQIRPVLACWAGMKLSHFRRLDERCKARSRTFCRAWAGIASKAGPFACRHVRTR